MAGPAQQYGHRLTVYKRHRRWSGDGTWAGILDQLRAGCDQAGGGDWTVSADPAVVRAHQHAAGGAPGQRRGPAHRGRDQMTTIVWRVRAGRGWAAPAAG